MIRPRAPYPVHTFAAQMSIRMSLMFRSPRRIFPFFSSISTPVPSREPSMRRISDVATSFQTGSDLSDISAGDRYDG